MYLDEIGQSISVILKNIAFLRLEQPAQYRNINSPFARMYLITGGDGHLSIGNETIMLEPGNMYLVPSFTSCTYQFNKGFAHFYVHFDMSADNGINIFNLYSVFNKVAVSELEIQLFNRLLNISPDMDLPHLDPNVYQSKPWINKKTNYMSLAQHLETTGIVLQLFSHFLRSENEKNMSSFVGYKMQPILVHIQSNLQSDINVEELAALACFSRDHFTRIFKSIIGIPPGEFVIRKRIEKAQFLLLTTDMTQLQIIEKINFRTVSYFCRIFKKYTGFTPIEYRKQRIHSV
jgi:AraC family transcriptional regulator